MCTHGPTGPIGGIVCVQSVYSPIAIQFTLIAPTVGAAE